MKTCIRIILTAFCLFFAFSGSVFADGTYIASDTKTTAVKFGDGEYEVAGNIATNGLAITKDGYMIVSPGAEGEITVTDGSAESELKVLPPLKYDFENNTAETGNITFSGEKTVVDNENCADGGELDISALDIDRGSVKLTFDFYKPDTATQDLLILYDSNGAEAAYLKVNERPDCVYLCYKDASNANAIRGMVFRRDCTFPIEEWNSISVDINLDTDKLLLDIGDTVVEIPVTSADIAKIEFAALVDNIQLSTGTEMADAALEIGLNSISVPTTGVYEIDPVAMIKIGATMHEIDGRYLSFNVSGTGIMPKDGRIILDSETAESAVTVSIDAIVSGTEYSAEKTVNVTKDAATATDCSRLAVYQPTVADNKIKFKVLNGNGMNLEIILSRQTEGGAMEYTKAEWAVDSDNCTKEIDSPGDNTTVYLIDKDSRANLLQQEGV